MRTYFDNNIRLRSQRLADLKQQTAELERRLSDARGSLERELADFSDSRDVAPDQLREARRHTLGDFGRDYDAKRISDVYAAPRPSAGYDGPQSCGKAHLSDERTDIIMSRGRRNAYHPLLARARKMGAALRPAAIPMSNRSQARSTSLAPRPPARSSGCSRLSPAETTRTSSTRRPAERASSRSRQRKAARWPGR